MTKRIAAVTAAAALALAGIAAPATAKQPNKGCEGITNALGHHHHPNHGGGVLLLKQTPKHCLGAG